MANKDVTDPARMEKIVSLCKRRGFIFQAGELYGGLNGCWDYGPLGAELKRNLKDYWWRKTVQERDDVLGMDGAILTMGQVLVSSGHVGGFSDPMVDCKTCKGRFRADNLESSQCKEKAQRLPRPVAEMRAHRAAPVQPDAPDQFRRHRRTDRLSPPGDRAVDLRASTRTSSIPTA